jgi:hypothetical protein
VIKERTDKMEPMDKMEPTVNREKMELMVKTVFPASMVKTVKTGNREKMGTMVLTVKMENRDHEDSPDHKAREEMMGVMVKTVNRVLSKIMDHTLE